MGIDLTDKLVESAYKVSQARNEYGDTVYQTATTAIDCLYRDISLTQRNQNRTEIQIDGLLWFGASESIAKNDVYYVPTIGYLRIEKITRAKTLLTNNTVKFIKCEVTLQRQVS